MPNLPHSFLHLCDLCLAEGLQDPRQQLHVLLRSSQYFFISFNPFKNTWSTSISGVP
jgi:hypothetical protein